MIWLPLVFVLLGISQPITSYFLPDILQGAGNLPEGTTIEIPLPQGGEVLAQTLQQFGVIGALIIALAFMGTVSGERSSGVASMILVKPVSHAAFLLSKLTAMLLIVWTSLLLGYLGAWYYTQLLIGKVDGSSVVQGVLVYGLWLMLIGTLTVVLSVWLKSPAATAFTALGITLVISLLASLLPAAMAWSPGQLPSIASTVLIVGEAAGTIKAIVGTFALVVLVIWSSLWKMKSLELQ